MKAAARKMREANRVFLYGRAHRRLKRGETWGGGRERSDQHSRPLSEEDHSR